MNNFKEFRDFLNNTFKQDKGFMVDKMKRIKKLIKQLLCWHSFSPKRVSKYHEHNVIQCKKCNKVKGKKK